MCEQLPVIAQFKYKDRLCRKIFFLSSDCDDQMEILDCFKRPLRQKQLDHPDKTVFYPRVPIAWQKSLRQRRSAHMPDNYMGTRLKIHSNTISEFESFTEALVVVQFKSNFNLYTAHSLFLVKLHWWLSKMARADWLRTSFSLAIITARWL